MNCEDHAEYRGMSTTMKETIDRLGQAMFFIGLIAGFTVGSILTLLIMRFFK